MKDEILAAYDRIAPFVRQTPLEHWGEMGAFLKLEHLQHTGSFKFRGASNKIAMLTAAVLWLLSPEASYITGVIIPVSGGR